jgi:hypothetical protein
VRFLYSFKPSTNQRARPIPFDSSLVQNFFEEMMRDYEEDFVAGLTIFK